MLHIVDHWLHVEASSLSHVNGPMLTLQPICRFSLASTLFRCTCPQEPLAVGLRSSFVASEYIPLDHSFQPFFSSTLPQRSDETGPRSGFAANRSCFSLRLSLFFFTAYVPIGFDDTGPNRGFTANPDCAVHRPSYLVPRIFLDFLSYLLHRSHVLTPTRLRNRYKSFPVDPLSCYVFSDFLFRGMPSKRT